MPFFGICRFSWRSSGCRSVLGHREANSTEFCSVAVSVYRPDARAEEHLTWAAPCGWASTGARSPGYALWRTARRESASTAATSSTASTRGDHQGGMRVSGVSGPWPGGIINFRPSVVCGRTVPSGFKSAHPVSPAVRELVAAAKRYSDALEERNKRMQGSFAELFKRRSGGKTLHGLLAFIGKPAGPAQPGLHVLRVPGKFPGWI